MPCPARSSGALTCTCARAEAYHAGAQSSPDRGKGVIDVEPDPALAAVKTSLRIALTALVVLLFASVP